MKNTLLLLVVTAWFTACNNNIHDALDVANSRLIEIQLENAANLHHAAGTFGSPARCLCKNNAEPLIEGNDFTYGMTLDEFYNTQSLGVFTDTTCVRIVEDGDNIANSLGLQVYAKDLSSFITPPQDRAYLDPARGRFVLPRPVYWCRCESKADVLHPDIDNGYATTIEAYHNGGSIAYDSAGAQWNKAALLSASGKYNGSIIETDIPFPDSGTAEYWFQHLNEYDHRIDMLNYYGNAVTLSHWLEDDICYTALSVNGANLSTDTVTPGDWDCQHHVYVVWNQDQQTIKVWLDGTLYYDLDHVFFPDFTGFTISWGNIKPTNESCSLCGQTAVDNIKIWHEALAADAGWLYNDGIGREDALHLIYKETNNYRPVLTDSQSGVGYYYIHEHQ